MSNNMPQYIFPEVERSACSESGRILAVLELIVHGFFIGSSVLNRVLTGVWISLGLAVFFWILALWKFEIPEILPGNVDF